MISLIKYKNPIIRGFYPDPSVCYANGSYYLVTSTFEYFPGVPIFKSQDLINWSKIGHCLDRLEQVNLENSKVSKGIYAPTIRFYNGWFYMITTNVTTNENFYVKTQNPELGWSDPVVIDGWGGIDPSLFFDDNGKVYIQGNSYKSSEPLGVYQAEIDLANGKLLSKRTLICKGIGGKAPEAPHVYKKDGFYYLIMAEGGTEFGHMSTLFRSENIYGPYISNPNNPILTNRSMPNKIQCVGHADIIQDENDNWWAVCLGVRINGSHSYYHHLGRETFLIPLKWQEGEWPVISNDGVVDFEMEGPLSREQEWTPQNNIYTFEKSTDLLKDFVFLRNPILEHYTIENRKLKLIGSKETLDSLRPITFLGYRQTQFDVLYKATFSDISPDVSFGITTFMSNNFHYECVVEEGNIFLRTKIGLFDKKESIFNIGDSEKLSLSIEADETYYNFSVIIDGIKDIIAKVECAFLASEVSGTFTGVMLGVFANSSSKATVSVDNIQYKELSEYQHPTLK